MSTIEHKTVMEKALAVNLDPNFYGTFAEIGAGQEVARNFFQAGGAAGTIGKTMSAYDMQVSNDIYGEESSGRYVCKSRVETMLEYEYNLLVDRVADSRPRNSQFFAFADTVAAKGYKSKHDCHGWIGVKGQLYPNAEPSQVIIHVRMLDGTNHEQQEALGILGVNLIYGMFFQYRHPRDILKSILDDLGSHRIEVDYCHFSGPYFDNYDNRLLALELTKLGLTNAVMFSPDGNVLLPSEYLYKKNCLVARGRFRPVTNVNLDMTKCAKEQFHKDHDVDPEKTVYLAEITMAELMNDGEVETRDFLSRIDMLGSLGYTVLISHYLRFFSLRAYLRRCNTRQIGIVLGVPNIIDIFNEDFYEGLEGGILKALGLLFDDNTKLYVYPRHDFHTRQILTTDNLKVADHQKHLYVHLLENGLIVPVEGADESVLHIHSTDILEKIRKGELDWKEEVPESIYEEVVNNRLFGFGSEDD